MKAFYVPELTSNALRVSEPDVDPSAVVSQLMKGATRAQAVCRASATGRAHSYIIFVTSFPNLSGSGVSSGNE